MVSTTELTDAAAGALGTRVGTVENVRREPLVYDAFLAGRSLARIRGVALVGGGSVPWSMIEKVTERPGVSSEYLYDGGMRELLAYRAGLLVEEVPGFAAAAAYRATEHDDGTLVLWLEDLATATVADWSPETFIDAARHLGRFGGRWLDRVPEAPWLFDGWIDRHAQPQAMAEGSRILRERLGNPAVTHIPVRAGARILEDQPQFRAALESLPQTLCHHDAVGANLFARRRNGAAQTVAIDWETVGPGAVGADIASLLFSSVRRGNLSAAWLAELTPRVLGAYGAGLADMGVRLHPDEIRLGFSAAVSLRWTLVRDVAVALTTPGGRVVRGSAMAEPPATAVEHLTVLSRYLVETAAEARMLAGQPSA